jgi:hypothetical protein
MIPHTETLQAHSLVMSGPGVSMFTVYLFNGDTIVSDHTARIGSDDTSIHRMNRVDPILALN